MREILFRGKTVENVKLVRDKIIKSGDWVEGSLVDFSKLNDNPHCEIYVYDTETKVQNYFKVLSDTVSEYTGLIDKNGRKIFEGDIIICRVSAGGGRFTDTITATGYVEMQHGAYGLHTENGYYNTFKKSWLECCEYEIIGNVYDNSELIKGDRICL